MTNYLIIANYLQFIIRKAKSCIIMIYYTITESNDNFLKIIGDRSETISSNLVDEWM